MHTASLPLPSMMRRAAPRSSVALLVAWLCLPVPAHAEGDVVLFRCTAADGALTVQNAPCPPGTQQRIQRFTAPASSAAPAAPPPAPVPAAVPASAAGTLAHAPLPVLQAGDVQTSVAAEGTAILDSDVVRRQAQQQAEADAVAKQPLPEIYACQGRDGGSYLHEREPAPPHCELMTVTGLGGTTPLNAAGCEVIRDTCEPVVDAQRCNSWQQRFRDARGRERFAAPENAALAAAERERLQAILADSDCPIP